MTSSAPLIDIRQLRKNYAGPAGLVEVLKGLNMSVAEGESIAIVGASGVGKSTLLHLLGALDRPSGGKVLLAGRDIFGLDERKMARFRNENIGFVFQFHHLLPEFNAWENVMMPALIAGTDRAEAKKRAEALLDEVGLAKRIEHKPGELSGGEQQRVAVARALVMEPRILLADEPTGNLDERTAEKVHELFVKLNRQRKLTTLVATHNESLASSLNRKVRMADGRLQAVS